MAGSPVRRAKRCIEDAGRALQEGRQDDAKRALAELRRTMSETGIDTPEMPQEIAELWISITQAQAPRLARMDGTALMSDQARQRLLAAGEIAAQRLLEVLQDERLFGYTGIMTFEQQQSWLNMALQRGFGGMAAGAQRVEMPKDGAPGQLAIGDTLQMIVRAKQARREGDEDADGLDAGVVDGELVGGDGAEEAAA